MGDILIPLPEVFFILGIAITCSAYYTDLVRRCLWPWESLQFAIGINLVAMGLWI